MEEKYSSMYITLDYGLSIYIVWRDFNMDPVVSKFFYPCSIVHYVCEDYGIK